MLMSKLDFYLRINFKAKARVAALLAPGFTNAMAVAVFTKGICIFLNTYKGEDACGVASWKSKFPWLRLSYIQYESMR